MLNGWRWGRSLRGVLIAAAALAAVVALLLATGVLLALLQLGRTFGTRGLLTQVIRFARSDGQDVTGPSQEHISILLLGLPGDGGQAPLLTDTLMLISVQPATARVLLLSIPRDLLVPYPDGSWRKLNAAYRIGEAAAPGHGAAFATNIVGSIIGVPIDRYAVVDFPGVRRVVDDVGGIRIHVDRWFVDYGSLQGAVPVCAFAQGWQWLDGERALIFARSRFGNNFEGSDFARMHRQHKVLLALHERLHAPGVLLNPFTMARLGGAIGNAVRTNLEPWQIVALWRLSGRVRAADVIRTSLAAEGLVSEARDVDNRYVLHPRDGDFATIREGVARLVRDL